MVLPLHLVHLHFGHVPRESDAIDVNAMSDLLEDAWEARGDSTIGNEGWLQSRFLICAWIITSAPFTFARNPTFTQRLLCRECMPTVAKTRQWRTNWLRRWMRMRHRSAMMQRRWSLGQMMMRLAEIRFVPPCPDAPAPVELVMNLR